MLKGKNTNNHVPGLVQKEAEKQNKKPKNKNKKVLEEQSAMVEQATEMSIWQIAPRI